MLGKISQLLLGLILLDLVLLLILVVLPILTGIAIISIILDSINRGMEAVAKFFK